MNRLTATLLFSALALAAPRESSAMITGGVGNKPLRDPGWPAGAAALFNHPGRIAWWEGPPLGGGEWHSECRGDARALAALLADFARLDAKVKRVVVHDGTGHSFWLAPNGEKEKLEAARINWAFTIWQPANWERLRQLPVDLDPSGTADTSPPARIDVYTAGLDWAAVAVPPGIEVIDNRLVAHGFTAADGAVMEGRATDLATNQPLAATIRLQRVEPQEQGGYAHPVLAEAKANADGRWVLKQVPAGWLRVVVEADGFAPRVAGYTRLDEQPRWESLDCGLARAAIVTGRVVGEDGKPMEGVEVSLGNVRAAVGGRYDSPLESASTTDAEGRFRVGPIPEGAATAWGRKAGYYGPGLGVPITAPTADVQLAMKRAASVRVTVDFGGKPRPEGYIVSVKPEGGEVVGSYGGSAQIDANNQFVFEILPPGRYFLSGRPNPGQDSEETEPIAVDLVAGQAAEITLKAR